MKFDIETNEYEYDYNTNFDIILDFEINNLKINFSTDLNNIELKSIEKFKKKFNTYKNKTITLNFLSSKKNRIIIDYNPKTTIIEFRSFNDGYIFSDVEDNYNSIDIQFEINTEEHKKFNLILERLISLKSGESAYNSEYDYNSESD
jgi:hypothetical protein